MLQLDPAIAVLVADRLRYDTGRGYPVDFEGECLFTCTRETLPFWTDAIARGRFGLTWSARRRWSP